MAAVAAETRQAPEVARKKRPTVLVHLYNMLAGGMESWFLSLASNLPEFRWRVFVPPGSATDPETQQRVNQLADIDRDWELACRGSDVLLAAGPTPGRFPGVTVAVSHCSGTWIRSQMALLDWADHFVGVSRQAATVCPQAATVIDNGVDIARCQSRRPRAVIRAKWGQCPQDVVIGHVGRLSAEKRLDVIVDAVKLYGPRAVAVFVGDGSGRQDLETKCRQEGIRSVFPGPMCQVGDAFAAFDVAAVTSGKEGFCLAAVEAMAAGCRLLTTNVGIIPDIRQRFGKDLFVTLPVSVTGRHLAESIDRARRLDPGPAQQIATKHFSAEVMASQWAEFLYSLGGR